MQRRHLLAAIAIAIGVAMALGISELAVRQFLPRSIWDLGYARDYMQLDPVLGWVHRPNLEIEARDQGRVIEFKTNADSLLPSGARREKRPGALRILMLGDSTTVGRSVPEAGRVHHQLELRLRGRGIAAEVINAGVEAYATDQALLRLEVLAPLYAPDVVIYTAGPADIEMNAEDDDDGAHKPRFRLDANGTLVLSAPRPGGQINIYAANSVLREWLQYSALYRAIQPALHRMRAWLGESNGHPQIGSGEEIYYSRAALEKLDWKLFDALVARMAAVSRVSGGRLYLTMHPALEEVWEPVIADIIRQAEISPQSYDRHALERKIAAIAQRQGIGFVPQIEEFRRRAGEGPFHLLPRDPHCNEICYRISAEQLAARIANDL